MTDKVVAITGASGGLGRVLAEEAARAGWIVVGIDHAPEPPDGLREALGPRAGLIGGIDLGKAEAAGGAMADAVAKAGRLDALVNVAGGFVFETVEDGGADSWRRMFEINVATTLNATRAALPHLIASGAGRVVNIGAGAALRSGAGMGAYGASKSAVLRLTESLAEEMKPRNVTVNAVLPSIIDTPGNRASMPGADFSRWVAPKDLAAVILFLISDAARAVTGALIPVTGRI